MIWALVALLVVSNGFWLLACAALAQRIQRAEAERDEAKQQVELAAGAVNAMYAALASRATGVRGH